MEKSNNRLKLWYKDSAKEWIEATPLGNGRLGCMMFGDILNERIQLNEDTLWCGVPIEEDMGSLKDLEESRRLIFNGEYIKAQELINKKMLGPWNQSYAPMGDLNIEFKDQGRCKEYVRELDLEKAVARVRYTINNIEFTRTAFISKPDDSIIIRFNCSQTGKINFKASLSSLLRFSVNKIDDTSIQLIGKAPIYALPSYEQGENPIIYDEENKRGMNFKIILKAESGGGQVNVYKDSIIVKDADIVTLKVIAHTSFNGFNVEPGTQGRNVDVLCENTLSNLNNKSYEEIYEDHIKDDRSLFSRVEFYLGTDDKSNIPTDERLERIKRGEEDLDFITLYFQYGRYLLISSSRQGTQPANLQGIWNEDLRPAWSSNYTTNINLEMNYWHAEVCNLSECHEPLFSLIKEEAETGRITAKNRYGCRGWTANHNIDLWRQAAPAGGSVEWAYWPMAGAWLCKHIWDHFNFTRDTEFLKSIYPIIKEAALFLIYWLIEDENGYLVTCPSISPENNFLTKEGEMCSPSMASTMDMALARNLFNICINSIDALKYDLEFKEELQRVIKRLYPYKIGKYGQLQEWFKDFEEYEIGHRHLSHLFGLYPGNEISEEKSKDLFEACRVSLERRLSHGGGHTGWSCAWVICLFARLKDRKSSYKYLMTLLNKLTFSNLFNVCPPFQIDGNFGGTAAIAEMIIQSHKDYIELLPAVPEEWDKGYIKGIKARGNFETDIKWNDNRINYIKIKSKVGGKCKIKNSFNLNCKHAVINGELIELNTVPNNEYIFN